MRVKFEKGKQREFLDLAINNLSCRSLRGLLQFGFDINYDSLKSYYTERRLMNKSFFDNLCHIAKIDLNSLEISLLDDNWGKIKGGKKSKKNRPTKN